VQTGGGGMGDGTNTCKILYGVEHPRTLLLRARLRMVLARKERGWRLAALYGRCGRKTADLIARGLLPRRLFTALFNRLTDWALDEWPGMIKRSIQ